MKKALLAIAGMLAALFVIALIYGETMSPEMSEYLNRRAAVNDFCDKLMQDTSLGQERMDARDVCDRLKAQLQAERPH